MNHNVLVSPVPARMGTIRKALRSTDLIGSVGLVDAMLHPSADWGQGILDGVEEQLVERWPGIVTKRVFRTQIGIHEPLRWAKAMAEKHAAIVIAAGD